MKQATHTERVIFNMSPALLAAVDRQAQADYISRSGLLRRAVIDYLRNSGPANEEEEMFTDPEEVLRIIQQRKMRAAMKQILKNMRQTNRLRRESRRK